MRRAIPLLLILALLLALGLGLLSRGGTAPAERAEPSAGEPERIGEEPELLGEEPELLGEEPELAGEEPELTVEEPEPLAEETAPFDEGPAAEPEGPAAETAAGTGRMETVRPCISPIRLSTRPVPDPAGKRRRISEAGSPKRARRSPSPPSSRIRCRAP